jgi:hypothetical protein
MKKPDKTVAVTFRIPYELWELIKVRANDERRTATQEGIRMWEQQLGIAKRTPPRVQPAPPAPVEEDGEKTNGDDEPAYLGPKLWDLCPECKEELGGFRRTKFCSESCMDAGIERSRRTWDAQQAAARQEEQ